MCVSVPSKAGCRFKQLQRPFAPLDVPAALGTPGPGLSLRCSRQPPVRGRLPPAAGKSGRMVPSCGPGPGSPPSRGTAGAGDPPGLLNQALGRGVWMSLRFVCLSGCFPSSGLCFSLASHLLNSHLCTAAREQAAETLRGHRAAPALLGRTLQPHLPPLDPPPRDPEPGRLPLKGWQQTLVLRFRGSGSLLALREQ